MEEQEMFELVQSLNNKDLYLLKECIEHEIIMSDRAIEEGFEKKVKK